MVRKRSRSDIRKFAMHYEQSENICQQQGWQNFPPYRDGEIIAAYQGRGIVCLVQTFRKNFTASSVGDIRTPFDRLRGLCAVNFLKIYGNGTRMKRKSQVLEKLGFVMA